MLLLVERQRQEQTAARQKERDWLNSSDKPQETWADRFTTQHKPAPLPPQPSNLPPQFTKDDIAMQQSARQSLHNPDVRTSSAPLDDAVATHLRGQNALIDPVTRQQLEDKRKKALEHQVCYCFIS